MFVHSFAVTTATAATITTANADAAAPNAIPR
uniref:Uncharacterized protein n=1 Tax=Arundo donax TaxID=35708 RepID=A0A0A8YVG6_ARUDO